MCLVLKMTSKSTHLESKTVSYFTKTYINLRHISIDIDILIKVKNNNGQSLATMDTFIYQSLSSE